MSDTTQEGHRELKGRRRKLTSQPIRKETRWQVPPHPTSALIHVLDAPGTFQDQAYKGWLYVGLIAGCLTTATVLVRSSDVRAWAAAALLPLGALIGFVVSRTIGLPGDADDIGNWTESLGLASLVVEGALIALATAVLRDRVAAPTLAPRHVLRSASTA